MPESHYAITNDGCPRFALAYVRRKRRGEAPPKLYVWVEVRLPLE
jgi:hypothetical protein